nr:scopoletin glucosyltransferase [Ipomoea batatas]GMC83326.1 scopoletin glucosyltransferase [Ipomoea batatas]
MGELHVLFFPLMAQGHMIPTLDMAKLFASRGVKATIITTPLNQPVFTKTIDKYTQLGFQMEIRLLEFPAVEVGLPEDCQSVDKVPSTESLPSFFKACAMLQEPLEHILQEIRPDCLVADLFFPWATNAAAKFDIPRLIFHGSSYLALCASNSLRTHKPFNDVSSDSELFTIPNLPRELKLTRLQVSPGEMRKLVWEPEDKCYGEIYNSFYELERDFEEHYRNVMGIRTWSIGPLSLHNRDVEDKAQRGKKSAIDEHECLEWLDSKNPNSVVYICFGSVANFAPSQLHEMAMGIEASEMDFVWFYNEKLATEILRIGVGVGSNEWKGSDSDGVKREAIAEAIKKVMMGEESEEMRSRAKAMKDKAKKAIEEGGSSYVDLGSLLDELRAFHAKH